MFQVLNETLADAIDTNEGLILSRRFLGRWFAVAGMKVHLIQDGFYDAGIYINVFDENDGTYPTGVLDSIIIYQTSDQHFLKYQF